MWAVGYWAGAPDAKTGLGTIKQNFSKGWIIDTDPYWTNQFGHPYEGSMFYTAARSTGHGPYASFGVAFLGSLMWEQFGEVQSPSVNDQITTPGGGSVLGEVLYRMNRLILDSSPDRPSVWRELAAFAVAPMAGANRYFNGERYRGGTLLPRSWMGQFSAGMVLGGWLVDERTRVREGSVGQSASINAHVIYGIPGTPDLKLRVPFDHFDFRGTVAFASSDQPTAAMLIRGLLVGAAIGPATDPHGLWGLFSSYDVISVPVFKAAGFGLGPGVSLAWRWSNFELHATGIALFLPWAGGGSMVKLFDRDYHFGPGAEGVLDFRALFGDRVIVDVSSHQYLISGLYATGASEDVTWGAATITVRVYGPHGLSLTGDLARRHATYPLNPDISQRAVTAMAYYTLLQGW
jgi:hypothetical protein